MPLNDAIKFSRLPTVEDVPVMSEEDFGWVETVRKGVIFRLYKETQVICRTSMCFAVSYKSSFSSSTYLQFVTLGSN